MSDHKKEAAPAVPAAFAEVAPTPKVDAASLLKASTAPGSAVSGELVLALIEAFLEEKKLGIEKAKIDAESYKRKEEALKQQNYDVVVGILTKQRKCNHLKGSENAKLRMKSGGDDYLVYLHTFISGDQVVKCNKCSMRWRPGDTREFLIKNGKKVFNHTMSQDGHPISWQDALMMCNKSSNTPSSSEVVLKAAPLPAASVVLGENATIPESVEL